MSGLSDACPTALSFLTAGPAVGAPPATGPDSAEVASQPTRLGTRAILEEKIPACHLCEDTPDHLINESTQM